MATKKEKNTLILLALVGTGLCLAYRRKKMSSTVGGYGATANHAAQWYPAMQRMGGPGPVTWTPLGPFIEHVGWECAHAHPGLSHQQWTQLYMRKYYGVDPSVGPSVVPALIGSDPGAVKI